MKTFKPFKFCVNKDGNPVCPPSKVLCKSCLDKISRDLEAMIKDLKDQNEGYNS